MKYEEAWKEEEDMHHKGREGREREEKDEGGGQTEQQKLPCSERG